MHTLRYLIVIGYRILSCDSSLAQFSFHWHNKSGLIYIHDGAATLYGIKIQGGVHIQIYFNEWLASTDENYIIFINNVFLWFSLSIKCDICPRIVLNESVFIIMVQL